MSLPADVIFDRVQSHALATGLFERVNTHEPKNAPGLGLTASIWVDALGPIRSSGLAETSGRVAIMVRVQTNMVAEPQDAIDPNMLAAVSTLLAAYSGDFTLGANVRGIDLLGAYGTGLSAQAGYVEQDGTMFRIMDITVPVIVNDIWSQSP